MTSITFQAACFDAGKRTSALESRGWRCTVRASGPSLAQWLIQRGNTVVMLAQSLTSPLTQQVQLPGGEDGKELCALLVESGLARPA